MKKILTTAIILMASLAQAEVMINEIMADNGGAYTNAAGESMDWVELYNPGATPVDLTGWRITDTVEDEWSKWKEIPEGTTVPAGGYLLLWGHNKDFPTPDDKKGFCGVTNGEVHVKLGLSSKGETITLAASEADYNATNFADQVTFGAQFADVSYGRDPGDTAKWLFFTNATPGAANGPAGLEKYPPDEEQGEGDDPVPHPQDENTELEEDLLDLGLSIVVIDTVDREEPAYEVANPPPGCWGAGIKNATKVPGRLRIKTTGGVAYDSGEYVKKSSGMTLKIRGNTSARATKKPYKIKLQKETDLLLRGDDEKYADSEWVLLASANSLNNVIGFAINDLLKLQWTPSYQYVNLVVNGTYRGVYLLCEGVNRNPRCRIDVADDGYLFELDAYWWNEDVYFKTQFCRPTVGYTFKYPDSDDITQEQVNLISNVMTHVEDAIDDGNYESCIDVNSFAAWLLGHDILGTSDGGGSNIYFTKYDAGQETKVRMANLWDFDTICRCSNDWSVVHYGIHAHFSRLCASQNLAFNDQYRREWLQLRRGLCGSVADILDGMVASGLAQSLEKSWACEASAFDRTYESFELLRQSMEAWFSDRVEWIDAHIGKMPHNPDPPVTVTEIMADNGGSYVDADGNASDWIELYNPGATDADISGWRLCDSTAKKWSKWEELPEGTVIPAGGYLIVWADDFTGWTNGEVHVNLGFSSKGEEVALAIAEGEIVSSFAFGAQHQDASFGRDPSDPAKLVYFRTPTPGAANGTDGIENDDCFNISINELMAENGGKCPNAAGEAMDWLELYNAGAANVDVSGWGFQDDPTKAWSKWKTLPEGAVVPAGGYLLVWGDNKDFNSFTGITNGEVHVNMGLSKKGEGLYLALTNGVGTVVRIDGFDFPKQAPDVSWGRTASDPDKFLYFTEPTPAAANGDAGREALVFTIDFDANGGTPVASVTNDYDAAISAPESTRTGYAFAGWYESGAAEPFVFSTMPARDVALTARWTANCYSVVYDPNGGEGASVTNGATYDAEFAVGACGFARTGYAFAGWTTNLDAAAEFAPGAAVSNLTSSANGDVTMYATWEANEYVLVYAADNGTDASVETNLAYDAEHIVLANPFAKIGHSFVSWTNESGVAYLPGDVVLNLTAEAGATVAWTAAWTANVYAVSFDSNGGSAVNPLVADYGAAISAPESTRTGYAFAGWHEPGAVEPFVFSTMPARDVALTARWTANEYTVRFNANGGMGTMADQEFQYDEEQVLRANVFTRMGYVFAGWNVSAPRSGDAAGTVGDGAVVGNLTTEADGVVTLYAVWNVADLVDSSEMHVDVEKGEKAPYEDAAAVYDGSLYDGEKIVGSVQVKVAKGKVDKSGVFSAKVTATVQLAGEAKKLNFKGGLADEKGAITEMTDKNGNKLAVTVGVRGLGGGFTEAIPAVTYRIDGARNVFIGKSAADKSAASEAVRLYQGVYNVAFDGGTLSVSVDKKGKAKIAGTVEGNKVSATSQLVVGKDAAVVLVVITKKKVNVAFCLWVMSDGTVEVHGADSATSGQETASPFWVAGKAGTLKDGAKFGVDGAALVRVLPGLFGVYLPNGIDVAANGTKWTVAGGVKAGKVAFVKGGDTIDESKLGTNPSGLKLTYKKKDGTFKGSFKAYNLESNGKIKAYAANVAGVMIGETGYGMAMIKKPACTLLVTIE